MCMKKFVYIFCQTISHIGLCYFVKDDKAYRQLKCLTASKIFINGKAMNRPYDAVSGHLFMCCRIDGMAGN